MTQSDPEHMSELGLAGKERFPKVKFFVHDTIPFPCQFCQKEIDLCEDENQDRVNEFHFVFVRTISLK